MQKKRLDAVGKTMGVGRLYEDYAGMLEAEKNSVDVVSVATPDESHAEVALAALGMGRMSFSRSPCA